VSGWFFLSAHFLSVSPNHAVSSCVLLLDPNQLCPSPLVLIVSPVFRDLERIAFSFADIIYFLPLSFVFFFDADAVRFFPSLNPVLFFFFPPPILPVIGEALSDPFLNIPPLVFCFSFLFQGERDEV